LPQFDPLHDRVDGRHGRSHRGYGAYLLIDDDGFYRRLIERALNDEGHRIVSAENGAEGIAAFRECRPDVMTLIAYLPLSARGVGVSSPNASLSPRAASVPGSGHWVMEEKPVATTRLVLDLLAK